MLQLNDLTLEPDQTVIKACEYQAMIDAEQIVQSAEQQAAKILTDAKEEFRIRSEQGYHEGLEKGRQEIAEEMIEAVSRSVDYFGSIEGELATLVSKCVRKVIGDLGDSEKVVRTVGNALAQVRDQARVTIRVSPTQVDAVSQRINAITEPYPTIEFVDVVADSRLSVEGCIIETDIGVVDASIDIQLRAIENSLAKCFGVQTEA